jgi:hypothetical protein
VLVGVVLFSPLLLLPLVAAVVEQGVLAEEEKAQVVLVGLETLLQQVPLKEIREEILVAVEDIFILTKAVQEAEEPEVLVEERVVDELAVRARQVL